MKLGKPHMGSLMALGLPHEWNDESLLLPALVLLLDEISFGVPLV